MSERAVAIRLKIPDNEAYTAFEALRRLGVPITSLERAQIWVFEDSGDAADFATRVERNETLFNPNKHTLAVLDSTRPGPGEAWIDELGAHDEVRGHLGGRKIASVTGARRYVAWRLFTGAHQPADPAIVRDAVDKLLANSAIERATIG